MVTGTSTNHWTTFKQTATKLQAILRHDIFAPAVFSNGLLIFKAIYGMSVNLLDISHIKAFSELDFSLLTSAPLFMLGIFLVLSSIGLPFRARLAWIISIILLLTALIYTLHFYPWLKFSIGFCIFALALLLTLRKDFPHNSVAAEIIFVFISLTTLLFYFIYSTLYLGEGFNPRIESLIAALYSSMEIMSAVGYGDVVPVSESAWLFTIPVIISGITTFATPMTSIFGLLIRGEFNKFVKGDSHTMHHKDHFIVCGHSILAISTILQLNQRGQNVTVINNLPEDDIKQLEQRLGDNADITPSDSNDSSVSKEVRINRCRAILALSDNDADNAFVIFSAKDIGSDVKAVLAVSDSKNLNKIRMIHPDIILLPQLPGSEILARILNGEEINDDMLASVSSNPSHDIFSNSDKQGAKAGSEESA